MMRREGSRRGGRRRKEGSRINHISVVCTGERKTREGERVRGHCTALYRYSYLRRGRNIGRRMEELSDLWMRISKMSIALCVMEEGWVSDEE